MYPFLTRVMRSTKSVTRASKDKLVSQNLKPFVADCEQARPAGSFGGPPPHVVAFAQGMWNAAIAPVFAASAVSSFSSCSRLTFEVIKSGFSISGGKNGQGDS